MLEKLSCEGWGYTPWEESKESRWELLEEGGESAERGEREWGEKTFSFYPCIYLKPGDNPEYLSVLVGGS